MVSESQLATFIDHLRARGLLATIAVFPGIFFTILYHKETGEEYMDILEVMEQTQAIPSALTYYWWVYAIRVVVATAVLLVSFYVLSNLD